MGLSTTHGCWNGSYGSFSLFRELVGRAAGLPYVNGFEHNRLDIQWDEITDRQIDGHWDHKPPTAKPSGIYDPPITDPVLYLLIHSDCDGKLRRGYLPALKARLEELEPEFERIAAKMPIGYQHQSGRLRKFIDGLAVAIEAGEHVEFY